MKRILITGAHSVIGMAFEKWMTPFLNRYALETLEMRGETWKAFDFSKFDAVFHVAGIAHADGRKISEEEKDVYFKINRDLSFETAKKAKTEGVKQFIFMSSIIVYGASGKMGETKVISQETLVKPANFYGESKAQGEEKIISLRNQAFKVAILRPPMIYGKGAKGNYPLLAKLAKRLPVFPKIENQRSMLYVENLCEFVRLMVEYEEDGLFFPQNKEYVNTSEMVRLIAKAHGKKIRLTKVFNPILKGMGNFVGVIDKAFGSLVYENSMSVYKDDYQIKSFSESVKSTEGKCEK